jgi:hypothetical protein
MEIKPECERNSASLFINSAMRENVRSIYSSLQDLSTWYV